MKLIVASDLHCSPLMEDWRRAKIEQLMKYIDEKASQDYLPVLAGDIVDYVEFREGVIRDVFCQKVGDWARKYTRLKGNHDRMAELPGYMIIDGTYIAHWDQFDPIWGKILCWFLYLPLPMPKFIYNLYRTPSKLKTKGELRQYESSVALLERRALEFCAENGFKAIIGGHTHSEFVMKREGYVIANAGDFLDSWSWLIGDTVNNEWKVEYLDST